VYLGNGETCKPLNVLALVMIMANSQGRESWHFSVQHVHNQVLICLKIGKKILTGVFQPGKFQMN
jgi:hypothetical protein